MKNITLLFFAILMSVLSWQGTAQGNTCDDPLAITGLPFTVTDNTENYGNDYAPADRPPLAPNSVGTPSASYLGGDDVVYAYTASSDGGINISVTNHAAWAGVFVFTGCNPFLSTVGGATNSSATPPLLVDALPVVAGETYYIVISTYPAPDSTSYTLEVTETTFDCPGLNANIGDPCDDGDPNTINDVVTADCECEGIIPPDGMVCEAPIEIGSLPYTTTDNTSTYGDDYESGDRPPLAPNAVGNPSANYLGGDDVVYSYTPTANGYVDISVTNHGTWAGVFVFTGCSPFESTVGGHTSSSGTTPLEVNVLPVNAGTTYYIVISTYPAPQSTPYTLSVTTTVFDCPGLNANIGDPCDDGDPNTVGDVITADCECEGIVPGPGASCEDAIAVDCNADPMTYSSVGSVATNTTTCAMGDAGLWFSFVGTGGDITVNSLADFDHEMSVNSGSCGDLSNIICRDLTTGAETYTVTASVADQMYYVYIAHWNSGNTTTGNITIDIDCATVTDPVPTVNLGSAANFAILAATGISSAGASVITNGDVGISPGVRAGITGFPPATVVNGAIYASDDPGAVPAMLAQAKLDLQNAYLFAEGASEPAPATVAGDLGGQTLAPGIYKSNSTLLIQTGDLTLDAQGDPDAGWIFQIASGLTTIGGPGGNVILTGGAQAENITWQVGSSATIGNNTSFSGNILAYTSITMNSGSTIDGRLLAMNGAVALTGAIMVNLPAPECVAPELTLAAQDATGGPIGDCIEAGGEYFVLATLSGGSGNDTYSVTANNEDPVVVDADSFVVLGPFTVGTDVNVTAVGVEDDGCSVSASIDSPGICGPDNDDCSGAIALECGQPITGNTEGATVSGLPTECDGFGSSNALDLFYSFQADGESSYTVSLGQPAGSTGFDGVLFLYSGICGDLSYINCSDSGNPETVELIAPAAGTYYVRIFDYSGTGAFVLNLECIVAVECPAPTDLAVVNITENSADFSWTTSATQSDIYLVAAGEPAPTENSIPTESGVTSPTTLDNLSANTSYDVYVRSDCGAAGVSDWSGPITFTTLVSAPSNDECTGAIALSCGDSVGGTTIGATNSGLGSPSCTGGSQNDVFYTLDVIAGTEYTVTVNGADYDGVLVIYSGSCNALTEIDCADDGFTNGMEETITFVADADETLTIRTYDWSSTRGSFTITVSCEAGTECDAPTNLVVDNVTENSADFSWTTSATQSDIYLVAAGEPAPTANSTPTESGVTSPTTLDNLSANTSYDVYVRSDCGAAGVSDWSGPITFTTDEGQQGSCEDPFNENAATSDVYISNIEIAGIGIVVGDPTYDFNYTSNSMSPNGYAVIANPTVTVFPGLEGEYTVSSGPNGNSNQYYYSVWVDFNQDGCFDADEQVIWSNDVIWGGGVPNGQTGVTNVPMTWEGMAPGTYQARIRNSLIDHPLAEGNGDGEALDFTVNVVTAEEAERLLGIESQLFTNFTFYPNPVEDQMNLNSSAPIEKVEVYNLLGQMIIQEQPNALEVNLATDQLQAGVYLMNITIDGSQKSFRVMKE